MPSTFVKVPLDLLLVKEVGRKLTGKIDMLLKKTDACMLCGRQHFRCLLTDRSKTQNLSFPCVSLVQLFFNAIKKKGKCGSLAFQ